jgi:putative ABC transport system permease protein
MYKNYLKIALRSLFTQKGHSLIKIFGLSIGIAACILIYLFVADEISFDKFHENADWLFRVVQISYDKDTGKETEYQQFMPVPVGPELERSFIEIKHQTRYVTGTGIVRYKEKIFQENLSFADSSFFEMFTFPLIYGEPSSALSDDHGIVLSRSSSKKYFDREDPRGETLTVIFGQEKKDFTVTGVAEDVPPNSSLRFDILIPFSNLPLLFNDSEIMDDWHRWFCPFFVQIQPAVEMEQVEKILGQLCKQYYSIENQRLIDEGHDPFRFGLQPVKNIHLDSRFVGTAGLSTSYLLSAIALIILLIACVNFMNLSIGSSSSRSTEVGVRKVVGAERKQIMRQFWGEALLISFFAVLLGVLFSELLLPRFNVLSGKHLSLATAFRGIHFLALLAIAFFTGIFAGSYPAVVMSSFHPVDIIKGKLKTGGKTTITKGLVVLQFSLSVILALAAVILGRQVSYMMNEDPGYASEGLVVVLTQENGQEESERIYHRYRNEVLSQARIKGMTASNREFGIFLPSSSMKLDGNEIHYRFNRVDPYFLSTMKLDLIQGRDFSADTAADSESVIVNERFMEQLGPVYRIGETLGEIYKGFPYSSRVVGVIKDCHFMSLRNEVDPMLLYVGKGMSPNRDRFSRMIIRIGTSGIKETIGFLEKAWKRIEPDKPFAFYFQDDALKNLYAREKRWSSIVRYASLVSILLACLGIFGLTAVSLSRRRKEIGIRKILGASAGQIVYLGIKEFILLISIANVIAWPVVYFVMRRVLQNYPYRVVIAPYYFLLAGAASVLLAVMTILYLSVRAALRNPADSLRYE